MSLSIINSIFAASAESAYLGTLGVRALEGDWGAALTAAAMADTMRSQAPYGNSTTMGSQAPTATADARRFASSPSDWCDCLRRSPLADLKARFDLARNYTPDEKLEMEVALFDVGDEIYRETARRLRAYLKGEDNFDAVFAWVQEQRKWVGEVHEKSLQGIPPAYDLIFRGLYSSSYQPVGSARAAVFSLEERIFFKPPSEEIARVVEQFFGKEDFEARYLVDGNGYRVSHSRAELAFDFIGNFVHSVKPVWEGNRLVVRHPLGASSMGATKHGMLKDIPWPLDFEDLTLKTVLEVLGWQIAQEIAGDQVILRIDFGASTLQPPPIEVWYKDLLEDLRKSVDVQLSDKGDRKMDLLAALGRVYKNRITAISDQPPDPSNWDYFLEDIRMLREALAKMEELQTSLQRGVEAGAFTLEEFWQALNRGDGRTSYENWEMRVAQAREEFAAALYQARRGLWVRFESLQGEMEVMKRELIRKIRSQEEALSIANWLDAETKRLKQLAGELGDLNKKLFQAGILEEPMKYAVSNFLHDKAIRDLVLLETYAFSIREGATDLLEKILRHFAPLPAGIKSLLERMTDDFYLRAAARGVSITSRCMEPTQGQITQLVESVSLELVEGILGNLIENGIKYSDPNQPRRRVTLLYNGYENVLEYTDNGIGMRPEFAAALGSEPGLRELDRVGDVQGTGTGWMIMTHNLRALGWAYEIETAPGEGLKVRIQIPPEHLVQAG